MRKYISKTIEKDFLGAISCNMCGKPLKIEDNAESFFADDFHEFKVEFGYADTSHDGEIWRFDLCMNCLENLANLFIIPPDIERYL